MVLTPTLEGEFGASSLPSMKSVAELGMVGVSHQTANLKVRSVLSLNSGQAQDLLQRLKNAGVREAIALSTCNRTEIYFVGSSAGDVTRLLCDFCGIDFETFRECSYRAEEWQVVRHLFAVASGLRSAAIGENEILGQIKTAHQLAKNAQSIGRILDPLIQRTLRAAKRIRTESGLGRRGLSLGSASVRRAFALSHGAASRSVLVIGSGQMAQSVVKHLRNRNHFEVIIISRTFERAQALAEASGYAVAPWEDLAQMVRQSNVLISAATVERPILDEQIVEYSVMPGTVLVDLGVPPNVAPTAKLRHDIKVVAIDELLEEVELNAQQVSELTPHAETLTEQEVASYAAECAEREAAPCIQAIVNQSEEVRRQNLEWALSQVPNASEKERKLLEDLSIRIARGMISRPIHNLKTDFRDPNERAVLARFFEAEA